METLRFDRSDTGVVTVTLDRPRRKNAMSPTMFLELRQTFRDIAADPSIRVVVVTGAEGEFCSGADLSEIGEVAMHPLAWMRQIGDAVVALAAVPQPVIAKVVGVAAGAGANLALGCDLIVASDDARFSEIFARRALSIDFGGSWLLPRLVGLHKAKELALFADIISAADAQAMGLVNRVVPRDSIDGFVDDWAARLAAGPPIALASTKRLLNASSSVTMAEAVEGEALAQTVNFSTQDTQEAMAAFAAKREPVFRGL